MPLSSVANDKKRAVVDEHVVAPTAAPLMKRSKARAETRPCPICRENVPLRLLGKHAALESERLDHITQQIGSEIPMRDEYEEDPSPNARRRLSAMKARQFIAPRTTKADSIEKSIKTLQLIKKHRKNRHLKLKEMMKEEDDYPSGRDGWSRGLVGGQIVCPICATTVRGDQGVLEAHVDNCVVNEGQRLEERQQRESANRLNGDNDWETFSEPNARDNYVGNLRGAGFHTRDRLNQDVDEEIDIDGNEDAAFGAPQFTEGDIMPPDGGQDTDADADIDVESNSDDPVAARVGVVPHDNPARLQIAARKHPESASHTTNVTPTLPTSQTPQDSSSAVCRICLDPYEEPTVSTGCWHTCCRGCWLRCLGSTKLCPICKRITVPSDLRRIYL